MSYSFFMAEPGFEGRKAEGATIPKLFCDQGGDFCGVYLRYANFVLIRGRGHDPVRAPLNPPLINHVMKFSAYDNPNFTTELNSWAIKRPLTY